jgi:hypothetical protein
MMACNEYHYLDVRLMGTIFYSSDKCIPSILAWRLSEIRDSILGKRWFSLLGMRWCEA